ncbi:MAG: glycosyltransferase [Planctomycetes bacterium]|nr:glycosyltransferase [Planctomycetota bacterium]
MTKLISYSKNVRNFLGDTKRPHLSMANDNDSPVKFSIIIPVWPDEQRPFGLDYVDKIDYPADQFEVILARGLNPCRQRNEAAKIAKGEILVFFDNDSCPEPDYLKRLAPHFSDDQVAGVGGPNPAVATDRYMPNLVDAVFTNPMAIGSKAARYKPVGELRQAGDSDFIFCNFAIRRRIYEQLNGLDERLCPNEENEFFERLSEHFSEKTLLYDPRLIAREPRPETAGSFLRKMFGYGIGRARQFKVRPSVWSGLHMLGCAAPILPIILLLLWDPAALLYLLIPYAGLLLVATSFCLRSGKEGKLALGIVPAIFAVHVAYTLGLWKGLFESTVQVERQKTPVDISHYNIPERCEVKNRALT